MGDVVNKFLRKMREEGKVDGHVVMELVRCKDGFTMSVQASEYHYCIPRNNDGPWTHVEVGFPSDREELLMPYAEDSEHPTETVYAYVPVEVVEKVIEKHGGLVEGVL